MRKRRPKLRVIAPDPRFGDQEVTKFINNLMLSGKKNVAIGVFYEAMDLIAEKTGEDPHEVWAKALVNATPQVEVRSRRIGGATFQIPTEIPAKRKTSIGMKWLIRFSRERNGKGIADKLANELMAASKGEGAAVKRKEDTHRMAESNRAFAHFRV
ncbi:30S ribosomal protein S7 [Portibacter lacus]|uniref:Small ribosomal subunit protein uS7 n=1 Tax=Portibacter lacus TaxID=1099794 RepID=A0AA37ST12_9BACT|nr:30S ribosomal protein S7 [Portibacter lacus]GLR19314.1 30S ribosomal protein S7 [Portibacter lacus]